MVSSGLFTFLRLQPQFLRAVNSSVANPVRLQLAPVPGVNVPVTFKLFFKFVINSKQAPKAGKFVQPKLV